MTQKAYFFLCFRMPPVKKTPTRGKPGRPQVPLSTSKRATHQLRSPRRLTNTAKAKATAVPDEAPTLDNVPPQGEPPVQNSQNNQSNDLADLRTIMHNMQSMMSILTSQSKPQSAPETAATSSATPDGAAQTGSNMNRDGDTLVTQQCTIDPTALNTNTGNLVPAFAYNKAQYVHHQHVPNAIATGPIMNSSLELHKTVATDMATKIASHKYVDFPTLLDPSLASPVCAMTAQQTDAGLIPTWSPLQPKAKPLSLIDWTKAFAKFGSVYAQSHPQ